MESEERGQKDIIRSGEAKWQDPIDQEDEDRQKRRPKW